MMRQIISSIMQLSGSNYLPTDTAGNWWWVAQIATNIDDGTDTIGAIAGAMAGTCVDLSTFPPSKVARVVEANRLDLEGAARVQLALRATRLAEVAP